MSSTLRCYLRTVGFRGLVAAVLGTIRRKNILLRVRRNGIQYPYFLRVPSSDVWVYNQIFIRKEYEFDVTSAPTTIIDAGANIGLTSIYLANKYPGASIIAIEPEDSNLEVLRKNIEPYRNITLVSGALWHEDTTINLVDPSLGNWGFMTQAPGSAEGNYGKHVHEVRGITIDTVMRQEGLERVDILKIDIEGAEREVFGDPSAWIGKIQAMIIELHERMKPGCNRSFYNGSNGFNFEWLQGGSVYLSRIGSCLAPRMSNPDGRK
jgi:FkbM family methyltransferase